MYENAIFLAAVSFIIGLYFIAKTGSFRNRVSLAIAVFSFLMAGRGVILYLFFNSNPTEQIYQILRAVDYLLTAPLLPLGMEMVRANIAARVETVKIWLLRLAYVLPPILLAGNAGLVFFVGVQGSRIIAMLLWFPTISLVMSVFLLTIVRNPFKMSKPEFSRGSRLVFAGYVLFYLGEGIFAGIFRMINIAFAVIAGGVFLVASGGIILNTITFAGIYSRMKTGYILVLNNYEVDSTNIGGSAEGGRQETEGTRLARALISQLKKPLEQVFERGEELILPYEELPILEQDRLYQIDILPHQLDSKGGVFSVLTIIDDVTSSIREKRLEELAELLDKVSNERDRAELYLNVLSHDICNLMQGISLGVELALENQSDGKSFLTYSYHQIEKAVDLLRDIQSMADLQQSVPEVQPIRICGTIQKVITDVKETHKHVDFDIRFEKSMDDVIVLAGKRIERVFQEIFEFALKKRQDTHLKTYLQVRSNDTSAIIEISLPDLNVSDPSKLGDLAGGIENRLPSGGLGLPLAKTIINSYGGEMESKTMKGKGMTKGVLFHITLPKASQPQAAGYQNTESCA